MQIYNQKLYILFERFERFERQSNIYYEEA